MTPHKDWRRLGKFATRCSDKLLALPHEEAMRLARWGAFENPKDYVAIRAIEYAHDDPDILDFKSLDSIEEEDYWSVTHMLRDNVEAKPPE